MFQLLWRFVALLFAALGLGLSFAHVLEAPPRLLEWSPQLWREATVFGGQYALFGLVGGPLDVLSILALAGLAFLMRDDRGARVAAVAAMLLYAAALGAWALVVAPANTVMAGWTPGPLPGNFAAVRDRWEIGHMIAAALKLAGFSALAIAILRARPRGWRIAP
jgi:hypothetical protein